ncbi:MAG: serine/threonine-protein kinase, partial [Verrucomicrobiota bacterium]
NESPPSTIGPYTVTDKLGEGGMGDVYRARQTEPIRREVALKIIKPGMDSRKVIARFETERQVLAIMDHPNIARVIDAGTTQSGHPYFVMELVEGISITEYCDEHQLTLHQRIELFIPVCQAIHHAHRKGIIHRDIKPSNVLVTEYDGKAVPKVIDFGVAKALDDEFSDQTAHTMHGQIVGTFEYMSPEQAELTRGDIDTRSDVYSLGVLLYELMTGHRPIVLEDVLHVGVIEVLRTIRETAPVKPSTRINKSPETASSISEKRRLQPHKLVSQIRGELDWIVMKAIEKKPDRRYESANNLANDALCFLNDKPVKACPPSTLYLIAKFVRQHRVATAFMASLAFFLGVITIGSIWGTIHFKRQEAEQRRLARSNRVLADEKEQERDRAVAGEHRARQNAYLTDMRAAQQDLVEGQIQRMVRLLGNHLP